MRTLRISTVLLSLMAVGSLAQTGPGQPAKPDQPASVVVGCLMKGLPGADPAGSGGGKATDYFVRTPTVTLPVGTAVTVGQPGRPDTGVSAGTAAADSYYRITGIGADQLQPHLNHRIEVSGHLIPAAGDATARSVTVPKTTVDEAGKATGTVGTRGFIAGDLHATGIKMISDSCK
jgi:hypothetical protein